MTDTSAGRGRKWKLGLSAAIAALASVGVGVGFYACSKDESSVFQVRVAVPGSGQPFALALYQSVGVRMLPGHQVSLLDNGKVFDALVEAIARAESSVHVLMYIWEKGAASDRVVSALRERAQAGVACRVLVDDFGSSDFDETIKPSLTQAGCEVRSFRPLPAAEKLARNHRKIAIFDGSTSITGGFGIRDNWLGDGVHADGWRDASVLFGGPAVSEAQQAFAENWQEAGGALLPPAAFPALGSSGPSAAAFVSSTGGEVTRAERLTQLLIAAAKKRIWIANAYFVPSKGILDLLLRKADEGVDVRILAPGKNSDSKTAFGAQHMQYGSLLKRGIRIWEYTVSMMHSKTMVVDDQLVLVGSINLDPLSLTKLEEAALVVDDSALAAKLAETFSADCKRAKQLLP